MSQNSDLVCQGCYRVVYDSAPRINWVIPIRELNGILTVRSFTYCSFICAVKGNFGPNAQITWSTEPGEFETVRAHEAVLTEVIAGPERVEHDPEF